MVCCHAPGCEGFLGAGERHRESVLQNIAVNLESWTVQTKQETAIYHTLNKLSVDTSRKVWYVTRQHYIQGTPATAKLSIRIITQM